MMNALKIRDYAARGFAAGLASHGIGTARAFTVDPSRDVRRRRDGAQRRRHADPCPAGACLAHPLEGAEMSDAFLAQLRAALAKIDADGLISASG